MVLLHQTHLPLGTPGSGGHRQLFRNPNSGELAGAWGLRSVTSGALLFSRTNSPGLKSRWKRLPCFLSSRPKHHPSDT